MFPDYRSEPGYGLLMGDTRAKQYLQSNALELASHSAVKLSRR